MTNLQACERFESANSATIDKLFWIAGSLENSDLLEMVEEMENDDLKKCFPDIFDDNDFIEECRDRDSLTSLIVANNKFGLLAEIHLPECSGFKFKKNKPTSWRVSRSISRVAHVYAETLEELIEKVEVASKENFEACVAKELKQVRQS